MFDDFDLYPQFDELMDDTYIDLFLDDAAVTAYFD